MFSCLRRPSENCRRQQSFSASTALTISAKPEKTEASEKIDNKINKKNPAMIVDHCRVLLPFVGILLYVINHKQGGRGNDKCYQIQESAHTDQTSEVIAG